MMMDAPSPLRHQYKDMVLSTVRLTTKSGLTTTGKVLSAGPRTLWVHLSSDPGSEDVFVAYDNITSCEPVT